MKARHLSRTTVKTSAVLASEEDRVRPRAHRGQDRMLFGKGAAEGM
jgi:hypothetical protein